MTKKYKIKINTSTVTEFIDKEVDSEDEFLEMIRSIEKGVTLYNVPLYNDMRRKYTADVVYVPYHNISSFELIKNNE